MNDLSDPKQYVAPGVPYDSGATAFCRLLKQGLRQDHTLLDFGAGSLRVGRFLITLLEKGNYYAIEPQDWLMDAGLKLMGNDVENVNDISLASNDDFNVDTFTPTKFDFILISSIITHQSHDQMARMFETAAQALAPDGAIVGDFRDVVTSGADYTGTEWLYPQVTPHFSGCIEALSPPSLKYEELDRDPYGALWFRLTQK